MAVLAGRSGVSRRAAARRPSLEDLRPGRLPGCPQRRSPSWRRSSAPSTLAATTKRGSATRAASRRIDLLELRGGRAGHAPDLVVSPGSHDEVLAVLEAAARSTVAVVPFGGGTSVVGGLRPDASGFAGTVALDLRRLDALVALDEESRLAVLEPGLRGPEAEALLGARGYTIGHFPQSCEYATLGGFAAARSSGQASAGYGRFDERVLALRVATPAGTLELGRAPKSAAGPDLRQLMLGSEGALGRDHVARRWPSTRRPSDRVYEGWRCRRSPRATRARATAGPGRAAADRAAALRRGRDGAGPGAAVRRWRPRGAPSGRRVPGDRRLGGHGRGGRAPPAQHRGAAARTPAASRCPAPATAGRAGATAAPYLRDALLDAGALVETLETVTFWSGTAGALRRGGRRRCATRSTGQGTPPVDPLPHLARLSGGRVAVLHGRLRPAARIRSPSGRRPRPPPARRSSPPAARSPTTTASAPTTARWYAQEIGRAGRRGAARGQAHARPGRDPQPRDPAGARGGAAATGSGFGMMWR